jgi:hypothetical protein
VLEHSAALLRLALALGQQGCTDGGRITVALHVLLQRLDACLPEAQRVSPAELAATAAEAHRLRRQAAGAALQIRELMGETNVTARFGWNAVPSGPTMAALDVRLEQLAGRVVDAAARWPDARGEIQVVGHRIGAMRATMRQHRAIAGDAAAALDKLQQHAGWLVQSLNQ